jgi:hypothetical protein
MGGGYLAHGAPRRHKLAPVSGPKTCAQCGRAHHELEPAFRRPDAILAVPADDRPGRVRESDDLCSVDETAYFIRCVAPVPVEGREEPFHWGFWVRVAHPHFDDYFRHFEEGSSPDHPGFPGTLANQTALLPPTLGLPVHVVLGRGSARPRLMLLDPAHPLTRDQERGVTEAQVAAWVARLPCGDEGERLEPPIPPFTATLAGRGWTLAAPEEVDLPRVAPSRPPRQGDHAKVAITYLAADPHGDVRHRTEAPWVRLDEVRADGWWGGTLANVLRVPGPIGLGSRIWLRAEQVVGFTPGAEPEPARSLPEATGWVARVLRRLRAR